MSVFVEDLMLELTRAANLVCDEMRATLLSAFRLQEGRLSMHFQSANLSGPDAGLRRREMVPEYSVAESAAERPYPGLTEFLAARASRYRHFGQGACPE